MLSMLSFSEVSITKKTKAIADKVLWHLLVPVPIQRDVAVQSSRLFAVNLPARLVTVSDE